MENQAPKLCLHSGAEPKTLAEIMAANTPAPTDSHFPIPHYDFVGMVEDQMRKVGFGFGAASHSLTHDDARYFGAVQLTGGSSINQREDFALVAAMRNSHDMSFSAQIGFGASVFVCDNLSFIAQYKVGRKHTVNILKDLPGLITACVSQTEVLQEVQIERFDRYRDQKLSDRNAHHMMIEMMRRGVINSARLTKVVDEWHEPTADHGGRQVWRLFNAATAVLKEINVHERPARTIELQAICDDQVGFQPVFAEAA